MLDQWSTGEIDALTREALASPGDDSIRAVLADLLQAAGDPLGELISLQLLPAEEVAAHARQARIQQLLVAHARRWLGPLAWIATAARFDRGFVQALELAPEHLDGWEWPGAYDDPRLAMVEELQSSSRVPGHAYAAMLANPLFTRIHRVEAGDGDVLEAIARLGRPIDAIALRAPDDQLRRFLEVCAERDELRELAISHTVFDRVALQPWFSRLTTLVVSAGVRAGCALWRRVAPAMTLVITERPRLEPIEAAFPFDYRVMLSRAPDGGVHVRLAGEWLSHPLDALVALPADVRRIEIEHTSERMADRVRAAIALPGVDVAISPPRRAGNVRWHRA